jgi:phenylacetic acid degradation protein
MVMAIYEFEGRRPDIGTGCYIHESADIIGDVCLGAQCYVGPGARIRGDYGAVEIGTQAIIGANSVIHARPDERCVLGDHVNIGHAAVLDNCRVDDWAVVGTGAVISNQAYVEEGALIGEGAVVRNHQKIGKGQVALGVPAREIGPVKKEHQTAWTRVNRLYSDLARRRYPEGLKRIFS